MESANASRRAPAGPTRGKNSAVQETANTAARTHTPGGHFNLNGGNFSENLCQN